MSKRIITIVKANYNNYAVWAIIENVKFLFYQWSENIRKIKGLLIA